MSDHGRPTALPVDSDSKAQSQHGSGFNLHSSVDQKSPCTRDVCRVYGVLHRGVFWDPSLRIRWVACWEEQQHFSAVKRRAVLPSRVTVGTPWRRLGLSLRRNRSTDIAVPRVVFCVPEAVLVRIWFFL